VRHLFQAELNPSLRAFKYPLILKFTAGMQTETQWILGWGPRSIGRDTIELRLLDAVCPEVAFTISPSSNGIPIFKTPYSRIVLFNEKSISTCDINQGDQIQIGDNLIEFIILDSFEEGLEIENG
jgi:hypothetical protein